MRFQELSFPYNGAMGSWRAWQQCPGGSHVTQITQRHEYYEIAHNDWVGSTGLKLHCQGGVDLETDPFNYGSWKAKTTACAGGYTKMKIKIEEATTYVSAGLWLHFLALKSTGLQNRWDYRYLA